MSQFKFMLDTNTAIYLLNGTKPEVIEQFKKCKDSVCISAIVAAELHCGGLLKGGKELEGVERFLNLIPIVDFDKKASQVLASVMVDLKNNNKNFRKRGFDVQIAAHAISSDLTLITNNEKDVEDITGLRVANWVKN